MTRSYSVVIPAYNAQDTIAEALNSVLGQTLPVTAIYVVDDGSTDRTAERAAAVADIITVIRKENGGPGSATSAGLRAATTDYVATLDSDDIWLPEKMERQIACLEDDPGLAAVFSLAKVFPDGSPPDPDKYQQVVRLWTRTTMVYRTPASREIGEMRDFPGNLGDLVDWLGRGRDLGHRHHMLEEVLAMRRKRPGSLSDTGGSDRVKGYLHAARDAIERRKRMEQGS